MTQKKELSELTKDAIAEQLAQFFFEYWQKRLYGDEVAVSNAGSLWEEGSPADESAA